MFYFIISFRNLIKRKLRTALTLVGVVLGVAVILAVNSSGKSIVDSYASLINDVSGRSKLEVGVSSPRGFKDTKVAAIAKTKGIKRVYPSITKYTLFFKNGNLSRKVDKIPLMLMAIKPKIDRKLRNYKVIKGNFLDSHKDNIILVNEFAETNNLKVGSKISVLSQNGPKILTVKGILKKVGPARQENGAIGFINLKKGQEMFDMVGRINKADIELKEGIGVGAAKKTLEEKFGSKYEIHRPASRSRDAERLLKSIKIAIDFFGLVAIYVGAFLIFNTFSMTLAERKKEIATLRSIGASRWQIMILILNEALLIGVVGSVLGVLLGRILAQAVFSTMTNVYRTYLGTVIITKSSVFMAASIGIFVSLLSAFYPARKAGLISPISVFKEQSLKKNVWLDKKSWLIGIIFLIVAFILGFYPNQSGIKIALLQIANFCVLIGITLILPSLIKPLSALFYKPLSFIKVSKIAGRNLPRAKFRSALTISALMAGLIMVIGIEAMNVSYHQAFKKWIYSAINVDLFVRPKISYGFELGKTVPVELSVEKKIAQTKGVKAVTPVKFFNIKVKNQTIMALANRPKKARLILNEYFVDGNRKQAYAQMEKGGSVIVSTVVRDVHGYKLGQKIPIKTSLGIKRFKVVGVISSFLSENGIINISWSDLRHYYKTNNADLFDVDVTKGSNVKKVKKRLEKKIKGYGLFIFTADDTQKTISKEITTTYHMLDAIVFMALIVAAFGIVNTLTMSVIERQKEIGVLRALGAYASQTGLIIMIEAAIIGLIGSLIGVLGGLFAAYFMVNATSILTHFPIAYFVPVNALWIGIVASLVLSVTAGFYPAIRAAKTNIISALHYE